MWFCVTHAAHYKQGILELKQKVEHFENKTLPHNLWGRVIF